MIMRHIVLLISMPQLYVRLWGLTAIASRILNRESLLGAINPSEIPSTCACFVNESLLGEINPSERPSTSAWFVNIERSIHGWVSSPKGFFSHCGLLSNSCFPVAWPKAKALKIMPKTKDKAYIVVEPKILNMQSLTCKRDTCDPLTCKRDTGNPLKVLTCVFTFLLTRIVTFWA